MKTYQFVIYSLDGTWERKQVEAKSLYEALIEADGGRKIFTDIIWIDGEETDEEIQERVLFNIADEL